MSENGSLEGLGISNELDAGGEAADDGLRTDVADVASHVKMAALLARSGTQWGERAPALPSMSLDLSASVPQNTSDEDWRTHQLWE